MKALTFTYFQEKTSNPSRPFCEECFWSKSLVLFLWCMLLSLCLNFTHYPIRKNMFLYIQMIWLGRQCLQLKQQYHNSENESHFKYIPTTLGTNWGESLIFLWFLIPGPWICNHEGAGKSLMIAEYTKVLQRSQQKHMKVHHKWWPGYWYRNIRHIDYILSMTPGFLIHYNFLFRASWDFSRKKNERSLNSEL